MIYGGRLSGIIRAALLLRSFSAPKMGWFSAGTEGARSTALYHGSSTSQLCAWQCSLTSPRVTSCCGLRQERFSLRYGEALTVPCSRSPGCNKKASSGFKAGGFSLLPGLRTKHH